jgi:hypothetical protein
MIRKLIPRRDKSPLAKPVPEPMSDVMIDLETLGRRPGCVVLSIGAVEFGPAGLGREFYIVLDIFGQKSLGLHEDPDTLAWWEAQSIEARQVLTQARDPKLPKFGLSLDLFNEWLSPIGFKRVKVWGNGSDFDNAILSCLYGALDQTPPWDFWNNRCYRTLKNLVPGPKLKREGTYHNALDDAKTQASHAIELMRQLSAA